LVKLLPERLLPPSNPEFFGIEYPFITPTDIVGSHHTTQTERFLSETGREKQKNLLLPAGAVCFTCIGATIGKLCVTTRASFTNQQINSVIVDRTRHDPMFVYYLLRYEADRIKGLAGGAATPIVNKTAFSSVNVKVAPLLIQQKIAATLSTYDDLIENNTISRTSSNS
jgi:type I restriction enzyme S subunit